MSKQKSQMKNQGPRQEQSQKKDAPELKTRRSVQGTEADRSEKIKKRSDTRS